MLTLHCLELVYNKFFFNLARKCLEAKQNDRKSEYSRFEQNPVIKCLVA